MVKDADLSRAQHYSAEKIAQRIERLISFGNFSENYAAELKRAGATNLKNFAHAFSASGLPFKFGISMGCVAVYLYGEQVAQLFYDVEGELRLDTLDFNESNFLRFGVKTPLCTLPFSGKVGQFAAEFSSVNHEIIAQIESELSSRYKPIPFLNSEVGLCLPLPFQCDEVMRYRDYGDHTDFIGECGGGVAVAAYNHGESELETIARARTYVAYLSHPKSASVSRVEAAFAVVNGRIIPV